MNEGCKDCVYFKLLEGRVTELEVSQKTIEKDVSSTKDRLIKVETKVDSIEESIKSINDKLDKFFFWILATAATGGLTLLSLLLKK